MDLDDEVDHTPARDKRKRESALAVRMLESDLMDLKMATNPVVECVESPRGFNTTQALREIHQPCPTRGILKSGRRHVRFVRRGGGRESVQFNEENLRQIESALTASAGLPASSPETESAVRFPLDDNGESSDAWSERRRSLVTKVNTKGRQFYEKRHAGEVEEAHQFKEMADNSGTSLEDEPDARSPDAALLGDRV